MAWELSGVVARASWRLRNSIARGIHGRVTVPGPAALAQQYVPRLERNLLENIVPFWMSRAIDDEHGGFRVGQDSRGAPVAGATKGLVAHARLTWLFARLARSDHGRPEHLAAARWGWEFLRDRLWDARHGGFYWEVDFSGREQLRAGKHVYGQAFAIFALSEYFLASGDAAALNLAGQCLQLLEDCAHDDMHGGYIESLERDWTPAQPGACGYLGVAAEFKTMNTHLHLLEALSVHHRARPTPQVRGRLGELIGILSSAVVLDRLDVCVDRFSRDWTPFEPRTAHVSYGHDVENVWLLIAACDEIGKPAHDLLPRLQRMFARSVEFGYDWRRGGFFESGPPGRGATARDKTWWAQAEALVCSLRLYTVTRDANYLSVFAGTYEFIERFQVDWEHGEWHARVTARGPTDEGKGHLWKAGYHNGRAMIECLELLKSLDSGKA